MFAWILFLAGIAGLIIGSDIAIGGARRVARALRIPPLIVGLTIISIGSSLPEMATNIAAGLEGAGSLGVGNIIGSEIAQITLILGIVGLVAAVNTKGVPNKREMRMLYAAIFLMLLVSIDGVITVVEGFFLVFFYLAYLAYIAKKEEHVLEEMDGEKSKNLAFDLFLILVGLLVVVFSSDYLVVRNGVEVARGVGISEVLIGIFIGVGTSMPELALSLRALLSGSSEMSLGNLIGSNITDPTFSLGLGVLVSKTGFAVEKSVLLFDFPMWLVGTTLALLFLRHSRVLEKKEAVFLIIFFAFFISLRMFFFPRG